MSEKKDKMGTEPVPAERAAAPSPAEVAFWESVRDSHDPEQLELYLDQYPSGFFATIAERKKEQCLMTQAAGGAPEEQRLDGALSRRRPIVVMPPMPPMDLLPGEDVPKYQIVEPFFAENHTLYMPEANGRAVIIPYVGPPARSMLPVNESGHRLFRLMEAWLDECHAVKCRVEGVPLSARPKELAEQMAADLTAAKNAAAASRGVQDAQDLPPSRPDLATPGAHIRNPRAARVGAVELGPTASDRGFAGTDVPILGTEGHRYQRRLQQGGVDVAIPNAG